MTISSGSPDVAVSNESSMPTASTSPCYRVALEPLPEAPIELFPPAVQAPIELAVLLAGPFRLDRATGGRRSTSGRRASPTA